MLLLSFFAILIMMSAPFGNVKMNNLFLFAGILFFVCSMTDGIAHQNKGARKEKNVNGTVLKQKAIPLTECSNISLECYECFCAGNHVSDKDEITRLQKTKNRVKRADNWWRLCPRCDQNYVYSTTLCETCSILYSHPTCAHCTRIATAQDLDGNPACVDHVGRGGRQDAVEHENQSARECSYCKNRATGLDRDGDPACSIHYESGRVGGGGGGHAGAGSSNRRECIYSGCTNTATGVDGDGDPVCANHTTPARECSYCTNTATGKDLDGDPACSDHIHSGGNRNRSCYRCGNAANATDYFGRSVCPARKQSINNKIKIINH